MFDEVSTSELIGLAVRAFVEGALILAAFWILFFRLRLWEKLAPLGKRASRIFLTFLLLWTTVQMIDRWQYFYPQPIGFYPVARFAMYQIGESTETVDTFRFVGQNPDGSTEEINLTEHFRSIGLPSLHTRLNVLTDNLQSSDEAEVADAREEIRGFVEGFAALVDSRGQDPPDLVELHLETYRIEDQMLVSDQVLETFPIEVDT